MKKHRPLNIDMNRIHENQEMNQQDTLKYTTMEITKSNVSGLGYDYLKSKLDYNKDLSSYTERLIENEIKLRQAEMDNYLFSGLNNLSNDILLSLKSKTNRYPVEFENQVKGIIFNRNESRNHNSNNNSNKKSNSWIVPIIIFFICICAVITNPSSEKHKEIIKTKCYSLMQKSIKEKTEKDGSKWESFGQALGMIIGKPIIDIIVENSISSDNYIFFSTTKITLDGETRIIGIGAFGSVFLDSRIDDALSEALSKEKQNKYEYK